MLTPGDIARIYSNVLQREESYYNVSSSDIRTGILNLGEVYQPRNTNWNQESGIVANFNDSACRCAYLHKYASLHTCLVQDIFHKALSECYDLKDILLAKFDDLKVCCLGGGPGTDLFGILSACQEFGLVTCSAEIVDLMSEWKNTFNFIVEELRLGSYGNLSRNLNANYFHSSYIASNLLQELDNKVLENIRSADIITIVKFISAATGRNTAGMVKTIFNNMKPGAVVLFIDNASGGFNHVISRSALECKLDTLFGPLEHFLYTKPEFRVVRYGHCSCCQTRVTVQILMKPFQTIYFNNQSLNDTSKHLIPKVSSKESSDAIKIDKTPLRDVSNLSSAPILMKPVKSKYFHDQSLNKPSQHLIPQVSSKEKSNSTCIDMTAVSEVSDLSPDLHVQFPEQRHPLLLVLEYTCDFVGFIFTIIKVLIIIFLLYALFCNIFK